MRFFSITAQGHKEADIDPDYMPWHEPNPVGANVFSADNGFVADMVLGPTNNENDIGHLLRQDVSFYRFPIDHRAKLYNLWKIPTLDIVPELVSVNGEVRSPCDFCHKP